MTKLVDFEYASGAMTNECIGAGVKVEVTRGITRSLADDASDASSCRTHT